MAPWTAASQAPLTLGFPRQECHAFLQEIFPILGWNLPLLCLLPWQAGSLPLTPPGKPFFKWPDWKGEGWKCKTQGVFSTIVFIANVLLCWGMWIRGEGCAWGGGAGGMWELSNLPLNSAVNLKPFYKKYLFEKWPDSTSQPLVERVVKWTGFGGNPWWSTLGDFTVGASSTPGWETKVLQAS